MGKLNQAEADKHMEKRKLQVKSPTSFNQYFKGIFQIDLCSNIL